MTSSAGADGRLPLSRQRKEIAAGIPSLPKALVSVWACSGSFMVVPDRLLIGPPLLDDHASSTIEHDIMRLVREWMAGGRVPLGTSH